MFSFLFRRRNRLRSGVFEFDTPEGRRSVDPALIQRELNRLNDQWPTLVQTLAAYRTPLPAGTDEAVVASRGRNADLAAAELARLARLVFDLRPLSTDGGGHSEAEVIGVLVEYLNHCRELMEDTRPLANSPAGTDSAGGD